MKFDASAFACRFAGGGQRFRLEDYLSAKEARHMDTFIHYGLAAAVRASPMPAFRPGTPSTRRQAERIGCIIGSGIGGLPLIEETSELVERGPADHAVLRAGLDRQHDRGPRLDPVRLPRRAEPGDR